MIDILFFKKENFKINDFNYVVKEPRIACQKVKQPIIQNDGSGDLVSNFRNR